MMNSACKLKHICKNDKLKIILKIVSIMLVLMGAYKFIISKSPTVSRMNKIGEYMAIVIQMAVCSYVIIGNTYKNIRKKHDNIILGALLGFSFALMFIGLEVLNPHNINWIMHENDRRQHFIGWNFYVKDNWHFPLGYYANWGYPNGMSIIFTDSIPLIAVIFKAFRFILPSTFQYLGMWLFTSFILMGVFSIIVLKKFTNDLSIQLMGAAILIVNPIIFLRVTGHTSLTSQWLILWAIYLLINEKYRKKDLVAWIVAIALSMSIHPYILFMVYILFGMYLFKGCFMDKSIHIGKAVLSLVGTFLMVVCIMYILGYFKVDAVILEDPNLGLFSANINSFINPWGYSKFIRTPLAFSGQYEGMAYMGAGGILLVIMACIDLLREGFDKNNKKLYITLIITCAIFSILSFSNMVTFYGKIIYTIPLCKLAEKVWSLMRATGRMIWPVWYIIIIYSFGKVVKSSKKNAAVVMAIILCLQFTDLSEMQIKIRNKFSSEHSWKSNLKNEFWSVAKEKYKKIATTKRIPLEYAEIAYYASQNGMIMEYGSFARNPENMDKEIEQNGINIRNNKCDKDTIYILNHDEKTIKHATKFYPNCVKQMDGYIIFAPKGFK